MNSPDQETLLRYGDRALNARRRSARPMRQPVNGPMHHFQWADLAHGERAAVASSALADRFDPRRILARRNTFAPISPHLDTGGTVLPQINSRIPFSEVGEILFDCAGRHVVLLKRATRNDAFFDRQVHHA
jgi:hypothetical protein